MDNKNLGKMAAKAGLWYVVSSILVKAATALTTPLFTRMLTTAEYGSVSTFTAWCSLLVPVFSLNLSYSIGRAKLDYPGKLDEYIGSAQLLSAITSAIGCAIVLPFIGFFSGVFELNRASTILLMTYLFFYPAIIFYQNGYRYNYQYKQNIAIAWYTTLSSIIISLVLIKSIAGNSDVMRILGITTPIVVLSVFFWIKSIQKKSIKINTNYWKYGIVISAPLVLHTISMNILSQSDRIFISKMIGQSEVGIYSLAYLLGSLLSVITTAISDGWLPWFHDTYYIGDYESIKKNVKPIVLLGCYIGLACIALAPELVLIFGGKSYIDGIYVVPPVVLGIICQYIYTHYVNIELHLKKTQYVSMGTIIAAIVNVILNYFFIGLYGYIAAAYTTLFSYFLLMLIHFLITRLKFNVKLYNDVFMFGALFVCMVIAYLLMLTYNQRPIRYIIICLGFASFIIVFKKHIYKFINNRKHF